MTQGRGLWPCPRKSATLGTFPPHSAALFVASLAFIADAPQISFLGNPKLRNYENVLAQSRGLWPSPAKWRNYGAAPPHSATFFAASLAFIADAPQISFLEIPNLRNCENVLTQSRGLWPFPPKWRNWGPPRPTQLRFSWLLGLS